MERFIGIKRKLNCSLVKAPRVRFSIFIPALIALSLSGCGYASGSSSEASSLNDEALSPEAMFDGTWESAFGIVPGFPDDRFIVSFARDGSMEMSVQRAVSGGLLLVAKTAGTAAKRNGRVFAVLDQPAPELTGFHRFVGREGPSVGSIMIASASGSSMMVTRMRTSL